MRVKVANSTPDYSQQASIRVAGEASKLSLDKPVGKRKQAEETLKESEARFRSLVESTSDWIWEIDRNGIYTYASPKVKELLGYEPEEVIGKTPFDFMPAEEANRVANKFKDIIKNNKPIERLENINRHKDGHLVTLETSGVPIFNSKGQLRGYRGVDRDITEHKQAEEDLRVSEERYRGILANMEDAYFEIDMAGNFTFLNDAMCRALGYSREKLMGTDSRACTAKEDVELVQTAVVEMYRTGGTGKIVSFKTVKRDGSTRFVEARLSPLRNEKGEINGFRAVGRDVTERKQAEQATRESEQRLKEAQTLGKIGNWEFDLTTQEIEWSDEVYELYKRDKALGPPSAEEEASYYSPKEAKRLREFARLATEKGEGLNYDLKAKLPSGKTVLFNASMRPVKDEKGRVIKLFGTIQDVTERKQAEEALRQSEERYRTIMEEIENSYFEIDLAGNLTFVNDATCRHLGYSREELVGMNYRVCTPPENFEIVSQTYNQVYRTGEPVECFPRELIRKDGSRTFSETSVFPLRNERGKIIGFRGVGRDVTERKQAEEALRESEQKYRHLAENVSDIIWIVDMNLRCTYMSPSDTKVRGYTTEEAMAQSLEEIFTPSSAETVVKAFTEGLAMESLESKDLSRVQTLELEFICKNGSTVWCEVRTSFIRDAEGQPVGILGVAREITERRKSEEALRQSEERYRTILDDMEESYYETDLAGNFTVFNDALCRHLDYSREEMMGMNYLVFTPSEDVKRVSQTSNRVYRTGEPVEWFPREMIRKDGSRTFTETSIFPLRNESGEIVGWRGVGRDVSERKRAEEKIRENEEKLRSIVENSSDQIFMIDKDYKFLSINKTAADLFKKSPQEMIGMSIFEIFPEDIAVQFSKNIKNVFDTGKGMLVEEKMIVQGRELYNSTSLNLVNDARGRVTAVTGIVRDITGRKRAEESLRQSEERYRTILEDIEDNYFEADLAGNITFVNDATCHNLGYSREELVGMNYRVFTHPEEVESVYQAFNEVFLTGKPNKGFSWKFVRKNGSDGFADASVSALRDREGKIIGFRGVGRDMTERKKAEQQLFTSGKLASVGELAAGVAHEINNPLTGVIGYAQLLVSRHDIPQDIKRDLDVIYEESQRAVKIVQNLLRFARQHKPDRSLTDINELVERTLELQIYKLRTSNITLTTKLADDLPWVVVDYNQIQQVILNIVVNSMQAMAETRHKGKITVTTDMDKDYVRIFIADNGPGIANKNITQVFDPFFTTKPVGSGSGLGLSVCHGIIAEHGGNIRVESTNGKGATFIIELPTATDDEAVIKEKAVVKKKRPRRRRKVGESILIVEDEPAIRGILTRTLSEEGYQVDTASSGKEALRKLEEGLHNIYIVDLKMPEMSGEQLYKIMKDKYPKSAERVVFITGDTITPETQNFLTSTGRPYLRKPFDYTELTKMVEDALRERRATVTRTKRKTQSVAATL